MYGSLSVAQLFGRFSSNAAVYGVSLVITRAGWILLLPIYWTRLSPEDYGIIGIAAAIQMFLNPVLSLGLYDAVQRFYFDWAENERRRRVAALWIIALAWSAVVCGTLLAAGDALFGRIYTQVPFFPYLAATVATAFFANFMQFPLATLRMRERAGLYGILNVASFASQAAITIALVIVYDQGVAGYLWGVAANAAVWAIVAVALMAKETTLSFRLSDAREPLRYALPTVPLAILDGLSSLLDRYFLDKHVGLRDIGLYNLGNQFGTAFSMFNVMMKTSWMPFLYRVVAERSDAPSIVSRFAVYYLTVLAVVALGVALLAKDLIDILGDPRYAGAYAYVPAFVLLYYIQAIAAAMGRGMDLAKKTALWPLVAMVSIVTAIVALSLLVPAWGAQGAVAALVIAAGVRVTTQVALSVHYYPRPLRLGQLVLMWGIALAAFWLGCTVPWPGLWSSIAGKTAIIAIAAVALARVGFGAAAFAAVLARLSSARAKQG
ncbi:MAG TPA: lipopolysaccharide biosynthesis protein [Burkholderiales bacterium]|nr:lipopolysaccharide biosynthesis protein [Burkholderiales bacterium]